MDISDEDLIGPRGYWDDGIWLFDDCREIVANNEGVWLTTSAFRFEIINTTDRFALNRFGFRRDAAVWEEFIERMAQAKITERITGAIEWQVPPEKFDEMGLWAVGDLWERELLTYAKGRGLLRRVSSGEAIHSKFN